MAKLGNLVQTTAEVTGNAQPRVKETARRVREAGYIQTGSLGRYGGADMMPTDAANLLLGLLCVTNVVDSAAAIPLYRGLFGEIAQRSPRSAPQCPEPLRWLSDTALGLTLGMALDRLIGMACEGTLQALFRELAGQQVAEGVPDHETRIDRAIDLGLVSLKLEFRHPKPAAAISFPPYLTVKFNDERTPPEKRVALNVGDRTDTATITHRTIFALGEALRS